MADSETPTPNPVERPRPTQQEIQRYIDGAMRRFDESPDSLEPYERRLLSKIRKASSAAQQSIKDAQDLRNQITQAEARLRSVELQAEGHQGAVNAYIDEVVTQKFGIEDAMPPSAPSGGPPPDTGSKTPMNRHEKRAAKAKGDKQETQSPN